MGDRREKNMCNLCVNRHVLIINHLINDYLNFLENCKTYNVTKKIENLFYVRFLFAQQNRANQIYLSWVFC